MRVLQGLGGITFRLVDHEVGECHPVTSRSLGVLFHRACPARFRTCDSDSPDQPDFQHIITTNLACGHSGQHYCDSNCHRVLSEHVIVHEAW